MDLCSQLIKLEEELQAILNCEFVNSDFYIIINKFHKSYKEKYSILMF